MKISGTADEVLRALVRRVDKKMGYVVRNAVDSDSAVLTLRIDKLSRELQIPLDEIGSSLEDLATRERLRLRIKRARDSMLVSVNRIPIHPTGQTRVAPSDGGSFFRTGGGGAGGPRR